MTVDNKGPAGHQLSRSEKNGKAMAQKVTKKAVKSAIEEHDREHNVVMFIVEEERRRRFQ